MGQHLQLYASNGITMEQARKWCRYRATDILYPPRKEDEADIEVVEGFMCSAFRNGFKIEHGSKDAVSDLSFLVWDAHVIDEALIKRVSESSGNNQHVIDWMRSHYGWVMWGDNDGV